MQLDPTQLDIPALRLALLDVEQEIRSTKAVLRSTWEPHVSMADPQRRLLSLRNEATAILILRAAARGKTHTTHRVEAWIQFHVHPLLHRFRRTLPSQPLSHTAHP